MRDSISRGPHEWPVVTEQAIADVVTALSQRLDCCRKSQTHGISHRLVVKSSCIQVTPQDEQVRCGVLKKFAI